MPRSRRALAIAWILSLGMFVAGAPADVVLESPGRTETLPEPEPHWILVGDPLLRRSALLDLDRGRFLGMISTGFLSQPVAFSPARSEIYVSETYYSRGSRGERTDLVTIYDTTTLGVAGEVVIPPKRAVNILPVANAAISDDDRFLAVFNMTPATSLSIVDLEARRFAGEIQTPGCSLVYAAGKRRFAMLCADGAMLTVTIDDRGREVGLRRSAAFFDPEKDPVTEKAVRWGDLWLFVSFEGRVLPVDVSGEVPRFDAPWSLVSDAERRAGWRIGGSQHLAVHQRSGRLFSLMHEGGADTHKDPGTELWVYDLPDRSRVERIELRHPGLALMGNRFEFGRSWVWPLNRLSDWLLDTVVPNPGLTQVLVTQDEQPLLVTGSQIGGSLAVYDALSGEFLRRIDSGNFTTHALQAPWGGERTR